MVEEPLVPKPKKPRSSIKIRRDSIDTLVEGMSGEKLEEVKKSQLKSHFHDIFNLGKSECEQPMVVFD